jgi:hypothetical protein
MPRDFFDPAPEQQNVVLIDAATLDYRLRSVQRRRKGVFVPFSIPNRVANKLFSMDSW